MVCEIYNVYLSEDDFESELESLIEEAYKLFSDNGIRISRNESIYDVCVNEG